MKRTRTLLAAVLLAAVAALPAGAQEDARRQAEDAAAVAEIVHRFHGALETADSATVLALLTDDAIILEAGGVETKEEYRGHHLPSDIAFARAVRREAGPLEVTVRGDVAWVTSTSVSRGTFRDRPVNSQGAELMVLVRTPEGWRISAVHWSSRNLRS
jgi:ketosteroid isomerase-like protein